MNEFSNKMLPSLAYELPDEVLKYKMCGDFAAASEAADRWLARPVAEGLKDRLRLEKIMLEKLPEDFPYTREQVIAMFREQVADFCEADLDRLDREGLAEWLFIDGEKHYIHNIVRNVTAKDQEIRRRAGIEPSGHALQEVIEEMRREGSACRRIRMRESVRLNDDQFRPGMKLRVHLPVAAEHHQISDVKVLAYTGSEAADLEAGMMSRESGCVFESYTGSGAADLEAGTMSQESGRAFEARAQEDAMAEFAAAKMQAGACTVTVDPADSLYRAICFEDAPSENREYFVEYEYTVNAVYHDFSEKDREESAKHFVCDPQAQLYLGEQAPHIRFSPYLRALAAEIAGEERDPLAMARRIYDYITTKVRYSFMREYFLIPDIPQYCARNLRGDCGVQALLFITLCRICGIPAKWQSGLYAAPGDVGPHDWALFYVEPYGWLFADPSFGGAAFADGDEARRSFYFGNLEPYRMAANNAFQQPFAVEKHFLPIDPYDNQSGEVESEERGYGRSEVTASRSLTEMRII